MNNPTCPQCDCVAGCQANPKACPNLAIKKGEIRGFMCLVDWQHELGESAYGTKVYGDIDDLRQHSPCVIECGIAEVAMRLVGIAQKQDFGSVIAIAQPEQPPVRQPLTYAKLIDMLVDVWDSDDETLIRFARAIEEAHGITKAEK